MSSSDCKDTHDSPNHRFKYTSSQSRSGNYYFFLICRLYIRLFFPPIFLSCLSLLCLTSFNSIFTHSLTSTASISKLKTSINTMATDAICNKRTGRRTNNIKHSTRRTKEKNTDTHLVWRLYCLRYASCLNVSFSII